MVRPELRADLQRLVEERKSVAEIAAHLGVASETASRWLADAGLRTKPKPPNTAIPTTVTDDELVAMYVDEQLGLRQIERRTGLYRPEISERLRSAGVTMRPGRAKADIDMTLVWERLADRIPVKRIAEEIGVDDRTLRRYINAARPDAPKPPTAAMSTSMPAGKATPVDLLAVEYASGLPVDDLAARHHMGTDTVRARLTAAGVTLRPGHHRRDGNERFTFTDLRRVAAARRDHPGETDSNVIARATGIRFWTVVYIRQFLDAYDGDPEAAIAATPGLALDYRNGESLVSIAARLGVDNAVASTAVALGGVTRRQGNTGRRHLQVPTETVVALYTSSDTITVGEVATRLGLSDTVVRNDLRRAGIPVRPATGGFARLRPNAARRGEGVRTETGLRRLYQTEGKTLREIADLAGVSDDAIRGDLQHFGIPARPRGGARRAS